MRAVFVVSHDGLGHKVRCGALADELRRRGWECLFAEYVPDGRADVWVIDWPGAAVTAEGKQYIITEGLGRRLIRPEFERVKWTGGYGTFDARFIQNIAPEDLATAMAAADLVITYGGMRAMEAACIGAPMVVIPRNGGEQRNIDYLRRSNGRASGLLVAAADTIEALFR